MAIRAAAASDRNGARPPATQDVAGRPGTGGSRRDRPDAMAMTTDRSYEVRITGLVPDVALVELEDVEVLRQEMRTVLSGHFADQAALYGFLQRLRSLGLEVVEVRQVAAGDASSDQDRADVPPSGSGNDGSGVGG